RLPGAPNLPPDGLAAVVSLRRVDLDADDYTAQLWLVPTDGGPARQLPHGWGGGGARHSPDGAWLAFVRAGREGEGGSGSAIRPQVWVMPTAGGEPRRLTDHPLGVDGPPVWSPDSTRLAYTARVPEE